MSVVSVMFSTVNRLLEKKVPNSTPECAVWEKLGGFDLENGIRTRIDLHRLESLLKSISCTVIKTSTNAVLGQKIDQMCGLCIEE